MGGSNNAAEYALSQLGDEDLGNLIKTQLGTVLESLTQKQSTDEEDYNPEFVCDLIEQLEQENPERVRYPDETDWQYYIYLGRRQLINELKHKYAKEGN